MRAKPLLSAAAAILTLGTVTYAAPPSTQPSGEIYVGGQVARPGTYSITGHPTTVIKAIERAGAEDPALDYEIKIVHKVVGSKLVKTTQFNSLKVLKEVPDESFALAAGDVVTLTPTK